MPSRLPQFRFSLRTLLIFISIPVPLLAWVASVKMTAVRQRNAVAKLESRGFFIKRDPVAPNLTASLVRRFVDKDAFQTINRAQLIGFGRTVNSRTMPLDREDLIAVAQLNGLRDVEIIQSPRSGIRALPCTMRFSDADLSFLSHMKTLGCIQADAELGEQSLLKLTDLPELFSLTLPNSEFSDEVLEQLGRNPKFKYLEFDASKVSAKGLRHLESLPVLQTLCLWRLKDDDALLPIIANYKALFELVINDSDLTMEDAVILNRLPIKRLTTLDCRFEPDVVKVLNESTSRPQTHLRNQGKGPPSPQHYLCR